MPIVPLPEPSEYERTKSRLRGAFGIHNPSGDYFGHLYETEGSRQYSGSLTNPDDFPTHITGEPATGISQFDNLSTEGIYQTIGQMRDIDAHYKGSRSRSDETMRQIDEIHDEIGVWDKEIRRRFSETSLAVKYPHTKGLVGAEGERRLPYPKVTKDGEDRRGIPINGSRAELDLGSYNDPDPYLPPDWSQYFNK